MTDGNSPHITRTFLGWDQPVLALAAQELFRHAAQGELDLSGTLVVIPGARAGRVLDSFLSQSAAKGDLLYTPPQFLTPGRLVPVLYQITQDSTPAMYERLAWVQALTATPLEVLAPLLRSPPAPDQAHLWVRYADLCSRTCTLLAGENIRPAEVPARAGINKEFLVDAIDCDRWSTLSTVLESVERLLAASNVLLPYSRLLTEVRKAVPPSQNPVFLVGVSELAGLARTALLQHQGPIKALIGAPPSHTHAFDALGCVIPSEWSGDNADIPEEALIFADTPASQAEAVFSAIAQVCPAPCPEDIVISAPDPGVTPHLVAIAHEIGGIAVRDAAALSLLHTPCCVLLQYLTDFCKDRTFAAYARLIRHPHIEISLSRLMSRGNDTGAGPGQWLSALDQYAASQAPATVDPQWVVHSESDRKILVSLYTHTCDMLGPLLNPDLAQTPTKWAQAIRDCLGAIYQRRRIKLVNASGRRTLSSMQAIAAAIDVLAAIPIALLQQPVLTAAEALQLVLDELSGQQVAPEPAANSIEVLGWLDAALDPAPIAILTGLNEGVVPEKLSTDPLLPESVASALGIACNASRLGRDAYLLALIRHSRRGPGSAAVFIAGRHNTDNDPLWPSRLLLPDNTLLERVTQVLSGPTRVPLVLRKHEPSDQSAFNIRPLDDLTPPLNLSVSNFKKYLTSPYEFYLDKALRLQEMGDPGEELDASSFGNLIHSALKLFGDSSARKLQDPQKLVAALSDFLDTHVRSAFGTHTRPELKIQIELARRRLNRLAKVESQRRREGWTIEHCEWDQGAKTFVHNGKSVLVRGTIDRIDHNAERNSWEIIDYKTSNTVNSPDSAHQSKRSRIWKDLQLPLYRHLAQSLTGSDRVALSYLALPRDPEQTALQSLSDEVLAEADIAIDTVISDILASKFSDPGRSTHSQGARGALLGLGLVAPDGARPPPGKDAES